MIPMRNCKYCGAPISALVLSRRPSTRLCSECSRRHHCTVCGVPMPVRRGWCHVCLQVNRRSHALLARGLTIAGTSERIEHYRQRASAGLPLFDT